MHHSLLRPLIMAATFMTSVSVMATEPNFYGLVYGDALRQNVPGQVNIRTVSYQLNGLQIAANVYTPAGYSQAVVAGSAQAGTGQYPAIVLAHPNGGVKEQVAGLYAQRLAELGYITIVADAAYQGASGGTPRQVDKPQHRIDDIHGMADFISQFAGVDASRLGLLGICGGGGYALKAAQTDKRFKSIATLSMFNSGLVRRNGFLDSQRDTIEQRLQDASAARALEAAGGEVRYVGDSKLSKAQIAALPFTLYREGYEYYGNTHAHPNSTFRYTQSSLLFLMNFDATSQLELLRQPLLMLAGSAADTLNMTQDAFAKAINARPKALFLIDGASHIQTYWKAEYVDQAVAKLDDFYGKTL